jgi:hypothetical protein
MHFLLFFPSSSSSFDYWYHFIQMSQVSDVEGRVGSEVGSEDVCWWLEGGRRIRQIELRC